MAGLTKTYTGDLTQAIAGKIWSVIKEADEKKKIEDSEASKEVKDAAKKLLKDDNDSIPVKDRDLRDTLANIFIPVETKLSKTKATTDGLSAKITSIGGSIADTQNLIINQNQILEDKLDLMLDVIGTQNDLANEALIEAKFDQLETTLEGAFDVAGNFGMESTIGKGKFRALKTIFRESIIRSFARRLGGKRTAGASKAFLNTLDRGLWKASLKLFGRKGVKNIINFKPGSLAHFKGSWGKELENLPGIRHLREFHMPKNPLFATKYNASDITRFKKIRTEIGETAAYNAITKGQSSKKALREATTELGGELPGKFAQSVNKSGILRRFWNSRVARSALVEKIGQSGLAKLGRKVAKGAFKSNAPVFGTAFGAAEGIARLLMGDPKGMMLSFGSAIPVGGWAFTMIDILRDIDREAYDRHIEPNMPMVTDDDFARFFMDALGITPDQFERGSGHISPVSLGIGNSIEQIVGATLAIGKAAGIDTKSLVTDAGLGSVNPRGTFSFDISSNVSGTSEPTSKMVRDRELPQIRKKKKKTQQEIEKETNDKNNNKDEYTGGRNRLQRILDPLQVFSKDKEGGGGIGGDPVTATDTIAGDGTVIEFWGQQGKDRSGEPGVDFSFRDYKSNYNLFPGTVLETGLLYGARYGNVVVVRSIDPSNGQEFDALYSHFPDGGMAVKPGQQVGAGQYLGKVGFVSVDTPGVPQMQPNNAGNMSGWHTSVDFFEPGSAARYENANAIINLVTSSNGQKPSGLLQKLTPPVKKEEDITPPPLPPISNNLDNIDGGKSLVSQAISNGSMERLVKKRNSAVSVPIIVNNQVAASSPSSSIQISSGGGSGIGWEQMQSARLGVA